MADPDHPASRQLGDLHAVGEAEGTDARVAVERGADTVAGAGREADGDRVLDPLHVRRDVADHGPHSVARRVDRRAYPHS